MDSDFDGYYFAIFPKYLQTKGFVLDKNLRQYSISTFIGQSRVDEISVIPTKQQKLYHTIFWLTPGKLEFKSSIDQINWDLLRIEVHNDGQLIGKVYLSIKDYIKQYESENQQVYSQKVKISDTYDMQFQLFIAQSQSQIDNLLIQHHGESGVRTPITKRSQERSKDESQLNYDLLKIVQSQIYTPFGQQKRNIFNKIDEESSINSSVPQSAPPGIINNRFAFKLKLNQVPKETIQKRKQIWQNQEINKIYQFSFRQKITLWVFGIISLVSIYLSMIPIKKI